MTLPTSPAATADDTVLHGSWYFGAAAREVRPGTSIPREILGEPVMIGRTHAGDAFALRDVCPHRGILLSAGKVIECDGGSQVECPYHGWRFRPDGHCAAIPALTGDQAQTADLEKIRTRAFPVAERHGMIFVQSGSDPSGEASVEPPALAIPSAATFRLVETGTFDGPFDDAVARLMDPALTPFSRLLGSVPEAEIRFEQPGLRIDKRRIGKHSVTSVAAVTPVNENTSKITVLLSWDVPLLAQVPKALVARGVRRFLARVCNPGARAS